MKQFIQLFISFTLIFFVAENNLAQELPGVFKTNLEIRGNNSNDRNDESGMSSIHQRTAEEKELIDQIQQLRQTDDRSKLNQILNLESQLEAIAPNVVSQPAPYIGGGVAPAVAEKNSFIPEAIGNTEIFSSGTKFVSSLATATEQRGSTEGRMWVAFSVRTTGARDTLRVFYSDDQGMHWTYYAYAWLGGTDQISYDEMDMEIIENTTGEKYIWIVYGYRNDAGAGRYRSGGLIVQSIPGRISST